MTHDKLRNSDFGAALADNCVARCKEHKLAGAGGNLAVQARTNRPCRRGQRRPPAPSETTSPGEYAGSPRKTKPGLG